MNIFKLGLAGLVMSGALLFSTTTMHATSASLDELESVLVIVKDSAKIANVHDAVALLPDLTQEQKDAILPLLAPFRHEAWVFFYVYKAKLFFGRYLEWLDSIFTSIDLSAEIEAYGAAALLQAGIDGEDAVALCDEILSHLTPAQQAIVFEAIGL